MDDYGQEKGFVVEVGVDISQGQAQIEKLIKDLKGIEVLASGLKTKISIGAEVDYKSIDAIKNTINEALSSVNSFKIDAGSIDVSGIKEALNVLNGVKMKDLTDTLSKLKEAFSAINTIGASLDENTIYKMGSVSEQLDKLVLSLENFKSLKNVKLDTKGFSDSIDSLKTGVLSKQQEIGEIKEGLRLLTYTIEELDSRAYGAIEGLRGLKEAFSDSKSYTSDTTAIDNLLLLIGKMSTVNQIDTTKLKEFAQTLQALGVIDGFKIKGKDITELGNAIKSLEGIKLDLGKTIGGVTEKQVGKLKEIAEQLNGIDDVVRTASMLSNSLRSASEGLEQIKEFKNWKELSDMLNSLISTSEKLETTTLGVVTTVDRFSKIKTDFEGVVASLEILKNKFGELDTKIADSQKVLTSYSELMKGLGSTEKLAHTNTIKSLKTHIELLFNDQIKLSDNLPKHIDMLAESLKRLDAVKNALPSLAQVADLIRAGEAIDKLKQQQAQEAKKKKDEEKIIDPDLLARQAEISTQVNKFLVGQDSITSNIRKETDNARQALESISKNFKGMENVDKLIDKVAGNILKLEGYKDQISSKESLIDRYVKAGDEDKIEQVAVAIDDLQRKIQTLGATTKDDLHKFVKELYTATKNPLLSNINKNEAEEALKQLAKNPQFKQIIAEVKSDYEMLTKIMEQGSKQSFYKGLDAVDEYSKKIQKLREDLRQLQSSYEPNRLKSADLRKEDSNIDAISNKIASQETAMKGLLQTIKALQAEEEKLHKVRNEGGSTALITRNIDLYKKAIESLIEKIANGDRVIQKAMGETAVNIITKSSSLKDTGKMNSQEMKATVESIMKNKELYDMIRSELQSKFAYTANEKIDPALIDKQKEVSNQIKNFIRSQKGIVDDIVVQADSVREVLKIFGKEATNLEGVNNSFKKISDNIVKYNKMQSEMGNLQAKLGNAVSKNDFMEVDKINRDILALQRSMEALNKVNLDNIREALSKLYSVSVNPSAYGVKDAWATTALKELSNNPEMKRVMEMAKEAYSQSFTNMGQESKDVFNSGITNADEYTQKLKGMREALDNIVASFATLQKNGDFTKENKDVSSISNSIKTQQSNVVSLIQLTEKLRSEEEALNQARSVGGDTTNIERNIENYRGKIVDLIKSLNNATTVINDSMSKVSANVTLKAIELNQGGVINTNELQNTIKSIVQNVDIANKAGEIVQTELQKKIAQDLEAKLKEQEKQLKELDRIFEKYGKEAFKEYYNRQFQSSSSLGGTKDFDAKTSMTFESVNAFNQTSQLVGSLTQEVAKLNQEYVKVRDIGRDLINTGLFSDKVILSAQDKMTSTGKGLLNYSKGITDYEKELRKLAELEEKYYTAKSTNQDTQVLKKIEVDLETSRDNVRKKATALDNAYDTLKSSMQKLYEVIANGIANNGQDPASNAQLNSFIQQLSQLQSFANAYASARAKVDEELMRKNPTMSQEGSQVSQWADKAKTDFKALSETIRQEKDAIANVLKTLGLEDKYKDVVNLMSVLSGSVDKSFAKIKELEGALEKLRTLEGKRNVAISQGDTESVNKFTDDIKKLIEQIERLGLGFEQIGAKGSNQLINTIKMLSRMSEDASKYGLSDKQVVQINSMLQQLSKYKDAEVQMEREKNLKIEAENKKAMEKQAKEREAELKRQQRGYAKFLESFSLSTIARGAGDLLSGGSFESGIRSLSMGLGRYNKYLAVTLEVGVALGKMATKLGQVQLELTRVSFLFNESSKTIGDYRDSIFKLANQGYLSTQELTSGMKYLAQAGYNASDSIKVLEKAMVLTTLTGDNMNSVLASAVSISNTWGGDIGKNMDLLTAIASNSTATMESLQASLKYVAGSASMVEAPLDGVTTILAILSDAGIRGSKTGIVLSNTLTRLVSPTKKAQDMLYSMGIYLNEASFKGDNFKNTMVELAEKVTTLNQAKTLFGERGKDIFLFFRKMKEEGIDMGEAYDKLVASYTKLGNMQEVNTLKLYREINKLKAEYEHGVNNFLIKSDEFLTKFIKSLRIANYHIQNIADGINKLPALPNSSIQSEMQRMGINGIGEAYDRKLNAMDTTPEDVEKIKKMMSNTKSFLPTSMKDYGNPEYLKGNILSNPVVDVELRMKEEEWEILKAIYDIDKTQTNSKNVEIALDKSLQDGRFSEFSGITTVKEALQKKDDYLTRLTELKNKEYLTPAEKEEYTRIDNLAPVLDDFLKRLESRDKQKDDWEKEYKRLTLEGAPKFDPINPYMDEVSRSALELKNAELTLAYARKNSSVYSMEQIKEYENKVVEANKKLIELGSNSKKPYEYASEIFSNNKTNESYNVALSEFDKAKKGSSFYGTSLEGALNAQKAETASRIELQNKLKNSNETERDSLVNQISALDQSINSRGEYIKILQDEKRLVDDYKSFSKSNGGMYFSPISPYVGERDRLVMEQSQAQQTLSYALSSGYYDTKEIDGFKQALLVATKALEDFDANKLIEDYEKENTPPRMSPYASKEEIAETNLAYAKRKVTNAQNIWGGSDKEEDRMRILDAEYELSVAEYNMEKAINDLVKERMQEFIKGLNNMADIAVLFGADADVMNAGKNIMGELFGGKDNKNFAKLEGLFGKEVMGGITSMFTGASGVALGFAVNTLLGNRKTDKENRERRNQALEEARQRQEKLASEQRDKMIRVLEDSKAILSEAIGNNVRMVADELARTLDEKGQLTFSGSSSWIKETKSGGGWFSKAVKNYSQRDVSKDYSIDFSNRTVADLRAQVNRDMATYMNVLTSKGFSNITDAQNYLANNPTRGDNQQLAEAVAMIQAIQQAEKIVQAMEAMERAVREINLSDLFEVVMKEKNDKIVVELGKFLGGDEIVQAIAQDIGNKTTLPAKQAFDLASKLLVKENKTLNKEIDSFGEIIKGFVNSQGKFVYTQSMMNNLVAQQQKIQEAQKSIYTEMLKFADAFLQAGGAITDIAGSINGMTETIEALKQGDMTPVIEGKIDGLYNQVMDSLGGVLLNANGNIDELKKINEFIQSGAKENTLGLSESAYQNIKDLLAQIEAYKEMIEEMAKDIREEIYNSLKDAFVQGLKSGIEYEDLKANLEETLSRAIYDSVIEALIEGFLAKEEIDKALQQLTDAVKDGTFEDIQSAFDTIINSSLEGIDSLNPMLDQIQEFMKKYQKNGKNSDPLVFFDEVNNKNLSSFVKELDKVEEALDVASKVEVNQKKVIELRGNITVDGTALDKTGTKDLAGLINAQLKKMKFDISY